MTLSIEQARDLLQQSEVICSADEVSRAVARVASEINARLADAHPLVLSVMGGAVVFTGQLLPQLNFALDFDYLHVSRYGSSKQGGKLHWRVSPGENVAGRVVLVVDDILDEGETLAAIRQRVLQLGAAAFYSAVFADKLNGKEKPIRADYVGIELPNRFVFGYGMDIHGAWRNLPAIYATKENL
jgi:hypoxanthine phosphoribosyltransferase